MNCSSSDGRRGGLPAGRCRGRLRNGVSGQTGGRPGRCPGAEDRERAGSHGSKRSRTGSGLGGLVMDKVIVCRGTPASARHQSFHTICKEADICFYVELMTTFLIKLSS